LQAAGTATYVSSPTDKSVIESRNQPSAKNKDSASSRREYSKSARKAATPGVGTKMFSSRQSWQVNSFFCLLLGNVIM
jgi:hypothetical protein